MVSDIFRASRHSMEGKVAGIRLHCVYIPVLFRIGFRIMVEL